VLSRRAANVYLFLSHWAYDNGLISYPDLSERYDVLNALLNEGGDLDAWVFGDIEEPREHQEILRDEDRLSSNSGRSSGPGPEPQDLQLIPSALPNWIFTLDDPDFYPSTPHGHYQSKTRPWPKLNPYTGRAFRAKDQEEPKLRLTKRQMILLWNDETFRAFCLEHVAWYEAEFPHYRFPVEVPYRLPRWRRR